MNKLIITLAVATFVLVTFAQGYGRRSNPDAKLHRFSTTIEKERPQLNQETKDLIAAYRRNPSGANYVALRKQVAKNYDAIVARKKAKLEELKRTARHQSKVDEMQVIVDEMLRDRLFASTYEVHGLPGLVGGAGDGIAALEVLE